MGAHASRGARRVLPAGAVRALFVGLDTLGGDTQLRVFLMAAGVFSPLLAQGWPAIYFARVLGYLNLRVDELALNSEQAVWWLHRIIERLNPALLRASAEVACAEINELAQRASPPVVLLPPSMAGRRAMLAARVPGDAQRGSPASLVVHQPGGRRGAQKAAGWGHPRAGAPLSS
jgi:hypothetical protein